MVMDETTDIPEAAYTLLRFYAHESCGKCTPCREGGTWMERILARVIDGRGTEADLDRLIAVGQTICPGAMPHAASDRLGLEATPFPVPDDDDLLPRTVRLRPGALGADAVPRGVPGAHPQASDDPGGRVVIGCTFAASRRLALKWWTSRPDDQRTVSGASGNLHQSSQFSSRGKGSRGAARWRCRMTATEHDGTLPSDPNAVAVTINGRAITARKGELVIAAAQRHDIYIPRFCYHERMNPVGMCRMCLVDIDTGRGPMLQPSCMVNVAPDMKVETDSPAAKDAQEAVIELLLANHPLDCPVCDKGGECPLQDQSYSHGPGESRYVEEKRHFEKPIPISDLVLLDRERCILCDRCTRFADEVAGDALIHFTQRGNQTQVMTFPDLPFSSYFSGNTVQICPVGALTATPYRFKARPWDLAESETTCTTCSVGCRMTVQSSRDHVVRHLGVDNDSVSWGWLCDRGRFNFEAINSAERITTPLVRG